LFAVCGRSLVLRSSALGIALGVPATILSAGNGIRALDVTRLMHHSLAVRAVLWGGWLILAAPALSCVFAGPGTLTVRALRLPRASLLFALFVLAALPQLPWLILFARGAGVVQAWAALTWAVALGASLIAIPRRAAWFVVLALGAAIIAWDPTAAIWACSGTFSVPFALHAAWHSALEQRNFRWRLTRPTWPVLSLYATHLLRLARSERSRLTTAVVTSATGSAGLISSFTNDFDERAVQRALTVMALPLAVAAALCVAPLLENERRMSALLRSARVPRTVALAAFLFAVATPSSALAAGSGVVVAAACQLSVSAFGVALIAWGASLGFAVAIWGRLFHARTRHGTGVFVAGVSLIATVATAGAYAW
jgi:hypothetical protein